jgi:hypothetical protein
MQEEYLKSISKSLRAIDATLTIILIILSGMIPFFIAVALRYLK